MMQRSNDLSLAQIATFWLMTPKIGFVWGVAHKGIDTLIQNTIHLSKTQYTCPEQDTLI